ncbi:MAG: hypothetical protein AAF567_23330 [Actinomycetota bacterium]
MPEHAAPAMVSPITTSYPSVAGSPLTLADESTLTKTLVRSDQAQFGLTFGHSRMEGDAIVAATRPDEWTILGAAEAVAAAEAAIDRGGFTSVIPWTHGRACFRLSGADASRMLEKVCGIDWSDHMTPDGAVVSASVALTTCDIIRNDIIRNDIAAGGAAGTPSYLLVMDRSFAQYLFDALIDAGQEFGIAVG